jgi:Gram-negative bacterial TonB protein C-terminal
MALQVIHRPADVAESNEKRATTHAQAGYSVSTIGHGFPKAVFRFDHARLGKNPQLPLGATSTFTPRFLVRRESRSFGWWHSLKAIFTRVKLNPWSALSYNPFRDSTLKDSHLGGRSWSGSFFVHLLAIAALIYLPQAFPDTSILDAPPATPEVIYYQVPIDHAKKPLPKVAPEGPGGRPGSGSVPKVLPLKGTSDAPKLATIVSKPSRPDNNRQTIIQPKTPDIHINADVKLPDLIVANVAAPTKAPLQFNPNDTKPVQNHQQVAPKDAPAVEQDSTVTALLTPSNFQPVLPVPMPAAPARRAAGGQTMTVEAPDISATSTPGGTAGVVVLSVEPGENLVIPPGNRSGEFATSDTVMGGSPGGSPNGVKAGGSGTTGKGGDASVGVGAGTVGGGGAPGWNGSFSVNGTGKSSGSIDTEVALRMIFPVPASFSIRKNTMIVSTGPIGGGGLDAYGVLNCGKIYTVFLPMPGKNWTMQYCVKTAAEAQGDTKDTYATVVHMGLGLVPPQAESKYDFKRLPVAPALVHKLIILKGTLKEDGTTDAVQVYQGILPEMDEAARLALGHWKFKPALREGKPVAVQILVGVPVEGDASAGLAR